MTDFSQLARTGGPCPHRHRGRGPRQLGVRQALLPAPRLPIRPATSNQHITWSTATSERTITWEDGSTYPVVDVEISSASHPFYTGQARVLDTAGRVEQFRRRYGNKATGA